MAATPLITGRRLFRLWILASLILMAVVVASVDQCEFARTPEGWCKQELNLEEHVGFLAFALFPAGVLFVFGFVTYRVLRILFPHRS